MRLASKPGRPKSAAFFDSLLTRFNRYRQNAARSGDSSVRQAAPCAPPLVTNPGDLIARALEILAEEDEAWRMRRGLDLTPRSVP
ncbi:hypothetical protein ACVWZ3_000857 [Bradyrhizobium sp. i1.3.6]